MMETDRELLELAAKAVELEIKPAEVKNVTAKGDVRFIGYMTEPEQWPRGWFDPLNNDSDAFRLEVALELDVTWDGHEAVYVGGFCECFADHGGDKQAARRKACLRAAAEIGRSMS